LSGAVEASGRGHRLDEAGEPGAGYIDGRTRALWLPGPLVAISFGTRFRTVGVHVAPLTVLAITIHGELSLLLEAACLSELPYAISPGCFRNFSTTASAVRYVRATAVNVGLPEGFCGKAEAPGTNRFATRQCCKYLFTTESVSFPPTIVPPCTCVPWYRVASYLAKPGKGADSTAHGPGDFEGAGRDIVHQPTLVCVPIERHCEERVAPSDPCKPGLNPYS